MTARVSMQFAFLKEADKLKSVNRANVLMDGSRRENTAEHSWHLALWAMVMADTAPPGADIDRAIKMALLHDLVEVDAGDHPIHLPQDHADIALKEARAADRIFGLLPSDQGKALWAIWQEFEAGETATAIYVRRLDMTQPLFQELANPSASDTDRDILRAILTTGRSAALADSWPDVYGYATALLENRGHAAPSPLNERLRFLAESDQLKSTLRATTLCDGSRRENSGEHSWHIALFALVFAEHAKRPADISRVIRMLLIHDLVEIDAGDKPIHGNHDPAEQDRIEQRAADRIYGLLPVAQGRSLRALWDEFEAAETSDAIFAKSIDRVQPVVANLETGGTSWIEYQVTRAQIESRVGAKVLRGAPALWHALQAQIDTWFENQRTTRQ